jgi:hypothetical protein
MGLIVYKNWQPIGLPVFILFFIKNIVEILEILILIKI